MNKVLENCNKVMTSIVKDFIKDERWIVEAVWYEDGFSLNRDTPCLTLYAYLDGMDKKDGHVLWMANGNNSYTIKEYCEDVNNSDIEKLSKYFV